MKSMMSKLGEYASQQASKHSRSSPGSLRAWLARRSDPQSPWAIYAVHSAHVASAMMSGLWEPNSIAWNLRWGCVGIHRLCGVSNRSGPARRHSTRRCGWCECNSASA